LTGELPPDEEKPIVEEATRALQIGLANIPPLFPDTAAVVAAIRSEYPDSGEAVIAVLSEGDRSRLSRVLEAHANDLGGAFDDFIVAPKSKETFLDAKAATKRHLAPGSCEPVAVAVGDALLRDIKNANQAGYITVYKPAGFKGVEHPTEEDEVPDFTIDSLAGLIPILHEIGMLRRSTLDQVDR
jgi:FMN phosphatase YigB (HAD superfamily)